MKEGDGPMTTREALDKLLAELPEEKLRAVLEFAEFLRWGKEWNAAAAASFAKCYGPDEPEYTEADVLRGRRP
jgi:hypothetical protein